VSNPNQTFNVLFLCTGNSARSILSEASLNRRGQGQFQRVGYPTDGLRSKSWDEFAAPGAPKLDFVFTVCDNAAGEVCPMWPGQPITAHWGIADPAAVDGTDEQKRKAFEDAFRILERRISLFLSLPIRSLEQLVLQERLSEIGRS
jgi:arsenate reductase